MYFVIENSEQLSRLKASKDSFIQVISSNDYYHPKLTKVSLVYYNNFDKGYVFVINHSEGFSLDLKLVEEFLQGHERVYLLDKKFHSYFLDLPKSIDLQFICLDKNNHEVKFDCNTHLHRDFYMRHQISNVNEIIPVSKHYEKCQCLYQMVQQYFDLEMDLTVQNKLIEAYKKVEENGIKVDLDLFKTQFKLENYDYSLEKDKIYSSYNLYNLTSRPTNSFNNVNFLAIPKEGDFRKCFVPSNDFLIEFDFDAYHLRLIANMIGFSLPKESMHTYLGKKYFQVEELTQEQYKESKSITFKQLYGGIEDAYKEIDFFKMLNEFIEKQWKLFNSQSAVILPTGGILRKQTGMSKLKLFNYIVQNLETKENIDKILEITEFLKDKKSKLILITYDSFLFDFDKTDGNPTLKKLKSILEKNNMVVKHKYGKNYAF